jgi:hypothetical protein
MYSFPLQRHAKLVRINNSRLILLLGKTQCAVARIGEKSILFSAVASVRREETNKNDGKLILEEGRR